MAGKDKPDRTFKTAQLFWHQGWVRRQAQRKIAELLGKPIASRIFDALPTPVLTESLEDQVCWLRRQDELRPFFLFVPRLQSYGVGDAYEKGKAKSDGQYSPHTAFRSLSTGNTWAAVDFVNEFGPLEFLDESEPRQSLLPENVLDQVGDLDTEETVLKEHCFWVDVQDFWEKHLRFVAVVKLWESRESSDAMRLALSEMATLSVYPHFGARRCTGGFVPGSAFPWRDGYFLEWASHAQGEQFMEAAATIVARELDLNIDRMRLSWACADPSRLRFHLAPQAISLWSAIWHLFARDTNAGIGWRVCPHCLKLFYPKRKDSYFCEPKYQKLYAANRWWNEHSKEELDKRRKERSKRQLKHKRTARNRKGKGRK